MRRWAWLALLLALPASAREPELPRLTAEVAPGELGEVEGKDVLIAADGSGREIFVYFPENTSIQRYTEKGRTWGDPIPLRVDALRHPITFIRMDAGGGRLALSGHAGLALFSARDGSLLAQHRVFQVGDVALLPNGDYAAALTNLPHPARQGSFVGRRSFADEVPRVVVYDGDGAISQKGLFEGSEGNADPSRAMARALRLSWGGDSLWAGEVGNYRVIELDRKLEQLDQVHDPEWDYQAIVAEDDTVPATEDRDSSATVPSDEVTKRVRSPGRDLARQKKPSAPSRIAIEYDPIVVDLDWGPKPGQVYWLLDRESFRGSYSIDRLDPTTGEVRRTALEMPGGFEGSPSQITVGARYVWLRGYGQDSPVLRVDRSLLDEGALQNPAIGESEEAESGH